MGLSTMKQSMHKALGRHPMSAREGVRGFTVIEIMIALLLGLLLSIGIMSLFSNVSDVNKTQSALALLQENGRYAMTRIIDDLRSANGQYCSNSGGAGQLATVTPYSYQDTPRAPQVFAKLLSLPDWGAPAAPIGWTANTPYPLTPRYFIQGYDCPSGTCTPAIPAAATLPAIGTNDGQRAAGADVLTVRGLHGQGTSITAQAKNGIYLASVTLASIPTNFAAGDPALLADCSSSRVVAGAVAGTSFTPSGNFDDTKVAAIDVTSDARLFDFVKDFRTATYFIGVKDDPTGGKLTSLIRRENGGIPRGDEEIVQGVERMDFKYGIDAFNGSTYFLTADQVDANTLGLACPPAPPGFNKLVLPEAGCLWRAVKSIDVSLLLNTVNNLHPSTEEEKYLYSQSATAGLQTPAPVLPSGLPKGRMLRREFRALVSVRNYVP
jgi:type IV pilus assembly protein PilW